MLLMYLAKKRAEVSPGVGPNTDMFYIDSGASVIFNPMTLGILDKYFVDFENATKKEWNSVVERMARDSGLIQTPQKQETQADSKPATAHEKGVPGSPPQGKPEAAPKETGDVKPPLTPEEKSSPPKKEPKK
jgi:hypothetical protein